MRKWKGIVIHHSASSLTTTRADIDRWHKERGFGQIGYHWLVFWDGRIEAGRPESLIGAHCKASGRNLTHLGICLVANLEYNLVSPMMLNSLIKLSLDKINQYNIDIRDIELHKEVPEARTVCPGKNFNKRLYISRLCSYLAGGEKSDIL